MIMCLIFSMKFSMAQLSPQLEQRFKTVLDSVCSKHRYKGVTTSVLLPGMGIWNGVYGISHDTVTIKHVMSGKTESMKYKKAESLIASGEWVLV